MTELELQNAVASAEGERIALRWQRKHVHDYRESPEAAKLIGDTLTSNKLDFNEANIEACFQALLKVPGNAEIFMPPAQPDPLPEVPAYMLKFSPLQTKRDIDLMDGSAYRKFIQGPDKDKFKARINEILRRGE